MRVYIIAGGEGTRVREYTQRYGCRKHEIPICGHPFNEYIEGWLCDQTSVRVDAPVWLMEPGVGTGGALATLDRDGPILVLYGDTLTPLDLGDLWTAHLRNMADMTVVTRVVHEKDYGVVEYIDDGPQSMLSSYRRNHDEVEYTTNVGMYIIGPRALDYIRNCPWEGTPSTLSLEGHLSDMMGCLKIYSYDTTCLPTFDVGTIPRIKATEVMMREYMAEDGTGRS